MSSPSQSDTLAAKEKLFSLSFAAARKPTQQILSASQLVQAPNSKRPNAAALTEDSDQEDHDTSKPQAVSGFEDGSAVGARLSTGAGQQVKKPLVIPAQKDAAWRNPGSHRRKINQDRPQSGAKSTQVNDARLDGEEKEQEPQYGLINSRKNRRDGLASSGNDNPVDQPTLSPVQTEKRLEEEAVTRLMTDGNEKRSTLVIPNAANDPNDESSWNHRTEADGFQADVASRPDSSTVADYEAVPIEEFGAAMLRGMGWKDGEGLGKSGNRNQVVKPKTLERRPNLLGIGAKSMPEIIPELGAWGKGAKDQKKAEETRIKGPRTREVYNPVVLRNSKTGEILTEEEFKAKEKQRSQRDVQPPTREGGARDEHDYQRRNDRHEKHRDEQHGHENPKYNDDRTSEGKSGRHGAYSGRDEYDDGRTRSRYGEDRHRDKRRRYDHESHRRREYSDDDRRHDRRRDSDRHARSYEESRSHRRSNDYDRKGRRRRHGEGYDDDVSVERSHRSSRSPRRR